MFDLEKWQEIYITISKHKLRTALTAFGVFWGIFLLVVLLGAGNGLRNGVEGSFGITKNALFVWSQRTSIPHNGFQPGRFIQFTNEDIKAIKQGVPEAGVVVAKNQLSGEFIVNRNENNASFQVYGDYPDWIKVKPLIVTSGRFINDIDIEEKRKVAIIGLKVQEELFNQGEDPIGQYISIKGIYFKVVGTFKTQEQGQQAADDQQSIYIPNTTLQQSFNQVNRIGHFALVPKPGIPAEDVENKVKVLLAARHNVAPDDLKAFGSSNVEKEFQKIQGLFTGIAGFSWLVSIGTIIAGIVGVGNIMLIIVKERTKEIGIRKALGARPGSIISMILQESLVITGVSGYFGLVFGVIVIEAINYAMDRFNFHSEFFSNPEIDFQIALSAIVVLVIAGTIAGFLPAQKAAKVNPVVALKDE